MKKDHYIEFLLLSIIALLSFDSYASMEEIVKAGQSLQQDVNKMKADIDVLKSTISQVSPPSAPQSTTQYIPQSTDTKAIEQLTALISSIEGTLHDLSYFGRWPQTPIYTTEAKPGIMAMAAEKIRGDVESQRKFEDWVKSGIDWITQPRTKGEFLQDVAYIGLLGLTIPMMTIAAKKTINTTLNIIEAKMITPKPAILLPGSKYGRTDRLKRWWAGYKTPPMIFDASVKERLEEIEEKTKNIRDHIYQGEKITYDNLLLYGKPGTGKTLFAQILADKTDMDFLPVTAASLLQSGVEGIKYFDELITMANKSRYGTIIFVDEADALFVDRDKLSPDSDHYKVLNHILAATGSGSNKFMLIAATNHAYVMDPAMGRRFQDRVLMPLPDENTRKELLDIYINEQLFDTKTRKPEFISAAHALLTQEKINTIAQQTTGLSHAEIKDMVTIMAKKANANRDGIITKRNVDSAITEAIEKMKALERDRIELEKKTLNRLPLQTQPQMIKEIREEEAAAAA